MKGNEIENPCFYLWNHNQGDNAISFGVTKSSETSFPATLPPTGVYTHGFGTISATTGITANLNLMSKKSSVAIVVAQVGTVRLFSTRLKVLFRVVIEMLQ